MNLYDGFWDQEYIANTATNVIRHYKWFSNTTLRLFNQISKHVVVFKLLDYQKIRIKSTFFRIRDNIHINLIYLEIKFFVLPRNI